MLQTLMRVVLMTTATDLTNRLQQMRVAQRAQPMPDWDTRAARLRTLRKMLLEQRSAFASAINADFGCRPREETDLLEIPACPRSVTACPKASAG